MKKTDAAAPSQIKNATAPAVNNAVKNLPVKELKTLEGHTASVVAVKFSSNGNYCVSGSYDRTLRLWNPQKGTTIKVYKGHGYQVVDLVISNDNTQIASCGGDRAPFLWDVSSGNIIRRFKGHDQRLNCIAWNSDNSVLATGSYDKTVKLWDCKSRSFDPIQTLEEAKDSVSSIFISNQEIVTGSIDGRVRVYDIRKGELRSDYIGQPVTCVSLSHDENILLVSTLDSTIRLLDKDDGSLYHEYKDHKNKEFKVDSIFTTDDAHVVSGSEDGNIYFWSLEEGELVYVSRAHKQMTTGVFYHPNECFMLSASADHTIKYWGAPSYELNVN